MLQDQPIRPANMQNVVAINQGRLPYAAGPPVVGRLSTDEAAERLESGCTALDVRSVAAFGEGHVPGSLHVDASSGSFEQFVGWVAPSDRPLMLVVEQEEGAFRAAHKLAFVGLERLVAGFVSYSDWSAANRATARLSQVEVESLQADWQRRSTQLLDVRDAEEWIAGHVQGSTHRSFKHLSGSLADLGFTPDRVLTVICGSGLRSSIACSILRNAGFRDVRNVAGGMNAWRRAGLPVHRR